MNGDVLSPSSADDGHQTTITTRTRSQRKFAFDELSKQVTFANRMSDNKLCFVSNDSCFL